MSTEETKDPSAPESSGATATAAESAPPSPEQIDELKNAATKGAEHYDRYLRTVADFENFKKRAARERQEAIKFANESMLQKLIPVIDNFDMALLAANQTQEAAADSLKTGVNMIYSQLKAALNEFGLEEIDAAGKKFDPNLHEAISEKETTDAPEGQVVQQLRKGYRLRERLIRPATVIVAKKPAGTTAS